MKVYQRKKPQKDIFEMLPQAIATLKKNILTPFFRDNLLRKYGKEKPPLRAELFSTDQNEQYAKVLAKNHAKVSDSLSEELLRRLAENEDVLLEVHKILTESVKENNRIVPAAEWLLDNFYLIEEQIYTGKKHLPKGYSKGLPKLTKGASEGLPRVYDIALEIISHSDGRVDLRSLTSFIIAYQSITTLKLGELWAIPIMLRLALIENMRRLAIQIAIDITNKKLAGYWADEMIEAVEKDPKSLVLVIADMARSDPPMVSSFVAELTRRLQEKGSSLSLPLSWIEQRLSENGITIIELVLQENQKQAADQVSISNSISSLRFLSTNDWREFVEATSIVEQILRKDRSEVYEKMDFFTRDQYRHEVEKIAKCSSLSETEIATTVIELAKESAEKNDPDYRKAHVGYYLLGKGLTQLEKFACLKLSGIELFKKIFNNHPVFYYTIGIVFLTALASWGLLTKAYADEGWTWMFAVLSLLSILASSQLAITLINWLATVLARPWLLPRMDFSKGIPLEYSTLVVVPTLLTNTTDTENLLENLEVRFLANRDEHLHFALLTDFTDADKEIMPSDESILQFVRDKIVGLNKKYGRDKNDTFFLFHRPRRWNAKDKAWMGYERKRGKLEELNALLRGRAKDCFSLIIAEESLFSSIKYVITLDTDTQLPRDTAWKMVGTSSHPLNHPLYSEKKKRVIEGYTILQPRVANSLPLGANSLFSRIHGNDQGTDPYTRAVSDVYQDLFQEGSFIGKGIYDVDAFQQTLSNRFPDNRILSHDLLEGCYARSGLMSDVQLYEEYPSRYNADMKRRHRWIRGDWQILSWIFPFVPGADKRLHKNPLSALSRWKIFDNLRRSLVPLSLLLLIVFGWIFSGAAWFWTLSVTVIIMLPPAVTFSWELYKKPHDVLLWQHTTFSIRTASNHFIQYLLYFVCLPYEAFLNAHAIAHTMWRMLITHKKLLEWNTASSTANHSVKNIFQTYFTMWFAPFLSVGLFIYFTWYTPLTLVTAMPVLIVWVLSPFIAWWVSLPFPKRKANLSSEQNIFLQKQARKIWAFFETFIGPEDNWLPPDNYQEQPVERIAHRTSPTNIGLYLLSNLTAFDFGYITAGQLVERTTNTISTMQRMEKFRGHLYNWYDTRSLVPLNPRYISTVDSGNMAGHLITLHQGLLDLADKKIVPEKAFDGLLDTVRLFSETIKEDETIKQFLEDLEKICAAKLTSLAQIKTYIEYIEPSFDKILVNTNTIEGNEWAQKVTTQIKNIRNDINTFTPWILLPPPPSKFDTIINVVNNIPTFSELSRIEMNLLSTINSYYTPENTSEENEWLDAFRSGITAAGRHAKEILIIIERLAKECMQLSNMDYDFLYDRTQHLLAIGYNADERRKDNSFYDLLASEARLTTFVGIAQGKLPQESWFALGRQLTNLGTSPILLSWSGSMFEYLMPLLVMPTYENTLFEQTSKSVVQKQIEYGRKRGVPWGISESGYNMVDGNLNYQYRAFGVPGLGLKRGLAEDLVISPYSSFMALMVAPEDACRNLEVLKEKGFEGKYGFYEAIDYTSSRLPRRQTKVVIKSFMAHHQGMSFLSLAYLLLDQPMQKRFQSEVQIKSTLLLLQERIPRITTLYSPSIHVSDINIVSGSETPMRVINTPYTPVPEIQLLSNGRYHVMVTNAGGGYSRWKNIAITRWREDNTCDNWGTFCFIRDMDNNNVFWSTAFQPSLQPGENYEAVFSQGRAEFRRRDNSLETHTEIVVSPEDDVELRRVHITNRSRKRRTIEVTSYAEVVLTSQAADEIHPAFSNLFVQTEVVAQRHAIICTRRPRSMDEHTPWMFHLMKAHDAEILDISYETDRNNFIGRGNSIHNPKTMNESASLSGSEGSVLDPIISIQYRIVIEPNETAVIEMVYGIADTKEICNGLIEKYQDRFLISRAFELAWTHSQVILRQINAVESDAQLYARLAGSVIFANPSLRTDPSMIIKNRRGQSALWSYSISGDLPIVIVQIENSENIDIVKQLLQAHAYWRLKGLTVDLVIWNEDHGGYRQVLQNQILGLITPDISTDVRDQPGGVFIRSGDQVSNEDRILFQTVARIVLSDNLGSLEEQINRRNKLKTPIPFFSPTKFYPSLFTSVSPPGDLQFFNDTGGFSKDGKEYVIITTPSKTTPAPWINVLANPNFGTIISESGQSYTWFQNAHELRLTPWNNDPVSDLAGEAFYLRDEESGKFWSPMPLPARGKSPYITKHRFGYSQFEHSEDGIYSEMKVYVDIDATIKFFVLKLHNLSGRARRISVTGYIEWVLGDMRNKSMMHIVTEIDLNTGALFAKNSYNTGFENLVAFFDVDDGNKSVTGDRAEFIGRNGTLQNPEAMSKAKLSGRTGAALDPCGVIQSVIGLAEDEERQIVFRLGAGKDVSQAIDLIKSFKGTATANDALKKVEQYWQKTLTTIQIETPDTALNILANGWLCYQTLSCRLWGRSGFYQSGGAFGFRDQLQDVLSLIHSEPALVRKQLVLCASRQFKEGDVQHWWHPPIGRGVRTTCSDDFLWLPYVTSKYILCTGDKEVLDEHIPFIEGRLLNAGEDSYYDLPLRSDQSASLYDHCVKAIEHGLTAGEHGLPLIGSGDWNDGMDKVGIHGKGESVWLAFFMYDILIKFSEIAHLKNDKIFSAKCSQHADELKTNIAKNAWDGEWYRRAWFDDGTALGSSENEECRIDSIAQSWSVLSKCSDNKRSLSAMESAYKFLVRKELSLIQLFDPPFDKSDLNPGYIKGYVPGVRENGGQYTHAAIWMVMAFAALGDKIRTWELLKMINPINRGVSSGTVAAYKVEPYVIAADVYAEPRHKGRGGWTWYTGSAGWMYQLIIESFLGIKRKADILEFTPCIPAEWKSFKINYRYLGTQYHLSFFQNEGTGNKMKIEIDGNEQETNVLSLVDDKNIHEVKITF